MASEISIGNTTFKLVHVRNLIYKLIPFLSGLLVLIALTVALIYSVSLGRAIPAGDVIAICTIFGVFSLIFFLGYLLLYFKQPKSGCGGDDGEQGGNAFVRNQTNLFGDCAIPVDPLRPSRRPRRDLHSSGLFSRLFREVQTRLPSLQQPHDDLPSQGHDNNQIQLPEDHRHDDDLPHHPQPIHETRETVDRLSGEYFHNQPLGPYPPPGEATFPSSLAIPPRTTSIRRGARNRHAQRPELVTPTAHPRGPRPQTRSPGDPPRTKPSGFQVHIEDVDGDRFNHTHRTAAALGFSPLHPPSLTPGNMENAGRSETPRRVAVNINTAVLGDQSLGYPGEMHSFREWLCIKNRNSDEDSGVDMGESWIEMQPTEEHLRYPTVEKALDVTSRRHKAGKFKRRCDMTRVRKSTSPSRRSTRPFDIRDRVPRHVMAALLKQYDRDLKQEQHRVGRVRDTVLGSDINNVDDTSLSDTGLGGHLFSPDSS